MPESQNRGEQSPREYTEWSTGRETDDARLGNGKSVRTAAFTRPTSQTLHGVPRGTRATRSHLTEKLATTCDWKIVVSKNRFGKIEGDISWGACRLAEKNEVRRARGEMRFETIARE